MSWFENVYAGLSIDLQAIIIISLVAVLGIKLGKIKVLGVSLGITFVFFVGILVGHFDVTINKTILHFAQNAGLVLFVYALGLQVGPGFFPSLRSSGLKLNILAFSVILLSIIMMLVMSFSLDISLPNMVGVLCGSATNTPALGAAQQAIASSVPNVDSKILSDMALATAVTYPLGVVGVILAIIFLRKIVGANINQISTSNHNSLDKLPYVGEFVIVNPAIDGMTIQELMRLSQKKFIISRVRKEEKVIIAKSDTVLNIGDDLMVICTQKDIPIITTLFGKYIDKDWNSSGIDWDKIDNSQLVSKKIIITQNKINGKRLEVLKLRTLYGVNVTRIERVGIQLLATPDLSLQLGDSLTIVGERDQIKKVTAILGDSVKQLDAPNLIAIFLGIALGLILGAIPISIPAMSLPLKLGLAGGPIVVGILMGAFGPQFKISTYTTQSTNLFMREFGLVIYLACLGIDSGEHFFETLMTSEGIIWIGLGFILTTIPIMIIGLIAMKILKLDYGNCVGMLSGSMTNPIALNYINSQVESDSPSVSYATVYPASTFFRIITAQILILLFY